ncbi:hypothetical protein E6P72_11200 [Moraxella osloensis]|nr:hypothetical protein [Moraxella osloensis]MDI4481635.1 hypothetical protein [Moraxella osloensis]
MPFNALMRDKISVYDEQGNLIIEDQQASVQGGESIITKHADFFVDVGYIIERKLPNGFIERYRVVEPNFMVGLIGDIPAHYQMKVTNVKAPSPTFNNIVTNNITVSDQARFYQDSVDNSTNTYNSYNLSQFKEALKAVEKEVGELDLHQIEKETIRKSLENIEAELKKPIPNKDLLSACVSFLPTAISTSESVLNLAQMLGVS